MDHGSHIVSRLVHLYRNVLTRCHVHNVLSANGVPLRQSKASARSGGADRFEGLEPLDSRVMMAVTAGFSGSTLGLSGDAAADTVTVRVNTSNELEYSTDGITYSRDLNSAAAGIQPFVVNGGTQINVSLGGGDDLLSISDSLRSRLISAGANLNFDGGANGAGGDKIDFSTFSDLAFTFTGANAGTVGVGNRVSFQGLEEVRPSYGNDTILVTGGTLGARVTDPGGTTSIQSPSGSLTITGVVRSRGDLTVTARDTLTLSGTARLSTRNTNASNDPVTGPSSGNSFNQTLSADSVVIENGAVVTAAADGGYLPADVLIAAVDRFTNAVPTLGFSAERSEIILRGTIFAEDVTLFADAADIVTPDAPGRVFNSSQDHDPNDGTNDADSFSILELLGAGVNVTVANTLPIVVMRKRAESLVQLDGTARIYGSGNVTITAAATADGTMEINPPYLSIGYSAAFTNAQVLLKTGSAILADNVTLASDANSVAEMDAETATSLGAFPGDPARISIALAITSSVTTSLVTTEPGSNIQAINNVNLDAVGAGKSSATAETGSFADGRAGIALGLAFANSNIAATVGGSVSSSLGVDTELPFSGSTGADILRNTINLGAIDHDLRLGQPVVYTVPQGSTAIGGLKADETYYVMPVAGEPGKVRLAASATDAYSGRAIDLTGSGTGTHKLEPELTKGVGVRATMASEDGGGATGGFGPSGGSLQRDILYGDVDAADLIGPLTGGFGAASNADGRSNSNTSLGVAGALSFASVSNDVRAIVGPSAVVRSSNDIEVKASLEEQLQGQAEATVDSNPDAPVSNAVSAAVVVGLFNNSAIAEVQGNARLDAAEKLSVVSEVSYPFLTEPKRAFNPADFLLKDGLGGDFKTNLGEVMDGTLGIKSKLFNTWARSTAQATNLGISGSITFLDIDNVSQAIIRSGARINRNETNGPDQEVEVSATTTMEMVNMDGIFSINLTDESLAALRNAGDRWALLNPMGNQGAKGGVGGSAFIELLNNRTTAKVEGNVQITVSASKPLTISATEDMKNYVLVQSGGSAKKFGVSGSFALTDNTSNVLAQLDSGVTVTAGMIDVGAQSTINQVIAMGSTQRGTNLGVGATVGINSTDRTTSAVVGSLEGVTPAPSTITTWQGMDVHSKADGSMGVFSVAAALTSTPTQPSDRPDTPPAGQDDDPLDGESLPNLFGDGAPASAGSGTSTYGDKGQQGRNGIAISGDVAIDEVTDNVRAYVNTGGTITATYFDVVNPQTYNVSALNKSSLIAASGSAAMATNGGNSAGIAGSVAKLTLAGETEAFIAGGATIASPAGVLTVTVDAQREGTLGAGSAGGAGAPSQSGIAVSGSVSLLTITNTTDAYINGGTFRGTRVIGVTASDESLIVGVAGSFSYGGRAGIGAAIALNTITNTTRARIIGNTTTSRTDLTVTSANQSQIVSLAGSAGLGNTVGAAGTVAINKITNVTEATVSGMTQTYGTSGPTLIKATDTSSISGISGAVGVSDNVGLGGALSYNKINNSTIATLQDSILITDRDVSVLAEGGSTISTITGGAALSRNISLAGSVSINQITGPVQARIIRGSITTPNVVLPATLTVRATDSSSIRALAGAVSGGSRASVGASVGANLIGRDIATQLTGPVINTPGWMLLSDARQTADIDALTIGASGAGSFAGGGAVSVARLTGTVQTTVGGGADLDAADVSLKATDRSTVEALAGGVAAAGTGAVGASVGILEVGTTTRVDVAGSTVTATQRDIVISADSATTASEATVAGSGAGTFALGGSVSLSTFRTTTEATVRDRAQLWSADTTVVSASDDLRANVLAGSVAGAGTAAAGAAVSVIVTDNDTRSSVQNSTITAGAVNMSYDGTVAYNGQKDGSGNRAQQTYAGAAVLATSSEQIVNIAAGAAGGGTGGIAGSVSVVSMDETTTAKVDDQSVVNGNSVLLNPGVDVTVLASDRTDTVGIGGALAAGGTGGIGAGADASRLVKVTEANIGGDVDASRNIIVSAVSREDAVSVGGAVSAGGSASIAGAAGVQVYTVTTRASIADQNPTTGGQAIARAYGNVVVSADHASAIDTIAGSISAGGAGAIGASAALPIINATTEAFIGRDARVDALAQRGSIAVNDGTFGEQVVADAANRQVTARPGSSATVSVPEVRPPAISNSDVNTPLENEQLRVTPNMILVQGLAVSATNRVDVESIGASGSGSGSLAAAVGVDALVLNTTTRASVDNNASVNLESGAFGNQSVNVLAGSHLYHLGVGGSGAIAGLAGAAPGAELTLATNTVRAAIEDGAQVKAVKEVAVRAYGQEDLLLIGAGLAGGGTVAAAGSLSLLKLTNVTQAYIGNFARVIAANVQLYADDQTVATVISGSGAVGIGGGGLAASVAANLITKTTEAYIEADAEVTASGLSSSEVGVRANSKEDLSTYVISGAGGFAGGVAGAVVVSVVDSNTAATIFDRVRINPTTVTSSPNSVTVTATNDLKMNTIEGTLAGGLFGGVAGSVDVGLVRGSTTARIAGGSNVISKSLTVSATALRDIDSLVVSAGGGAVGLAGSISIYNLGPALGGTAQGALLASGGSSVGSFVDSTVVGGLTSSVNTLLGGYSSADRNGSDPAPDSTQILGNAVRDARTTLAAADDSNTSGAINGTAAPAGTSASIADTASVTYQNMLLSASETVSGNTSAGAAALGGLAIGGSVVFFNNASNVSATLSGTLTAPTSFGFATVSATQSVTIDGVGVAGSGGSLALGAQYVEVSDGTSVTATVSPSANYISGHGLTMLARGSRDLDARAIGGAIGGVAAGLSLARATVSGPVKTTVQSGARFNSNLIGTVDMRAESTAIANSEARPVVAGVLSGAGADASSTTSPQVEVSLPASTRLTGARTGNLRMIAQSFTKPTAMAEGAAIGSLGGLGLSQATATSTPTVTASIGADSVINAFSVTLQASQNVQTSGQLELGNTAAAVANASGGGVVGGAGGAIATAVNSPVVKAEIGARSDVNTDFETVVGSQSANPASARAVGAGLGIVGIGASMARATAAGSTTSAIGASTTIDSARSFLGVRARAVDTTDALSVAAAGGLVALGVNLADARTTPTVSATLGDSVAVNVDSFIELTIDSEVHSNADSRGIAAGVVANVGTSSASATTTPTLQVGVGLNDRLIGRTGQVFITAFVNATSSGLFISNAATANSSASLVGLLFAGADATSTTVVSTLTPTINIGAGATIFAGRDIAAGSNAGLLRLLNIVGNDTGLTASASTGGLFTRSGTSATSTTRTAATLNIGQSARLQARDAMVVDTIAQGTARETVTGGGGNSITQFLRDLFGGNLSQAFSNPPGILSSGGTLATMLVDTDSTVNIGALAQLVATDMTIASQATMQIDVLSTMRSQGALAAEATSLAVVDADSDALIVIGQSANLSAVTMALNATNIVDAQVRASATSSVSIGGADTTGITRLNIGTADQSQAVVSIGQGAILTADTRVNLNAITRQSTGAPKLRSEAAARADGGVTANARALADGTANVVARVVNAGSVVAPTINVSAKASQADIDMDRLPIASATTIVSRFVSRTRNVIDRIVQWLPWPLDAIVRTVTRVVTDLIEVFDLSTSTGTQGGAGAVRSSSFTNNGTLFNQPPAGRRITIDGATFGPGGEDGYHTENGRIVLDPIVSGGQFHLSVEVPEGEIDGDGEVQVHSYMNEVEVINNTDMDLELGNIEMVLGEHGDNAFDPQIDEHSASGALRINREVVHTRLTITDNGAGDVILDEPLQNVSADIHISAHGNILAANDAVFIESGDVGALTLEAGGSIGTPMHPLHIKAIHGWYMPDGSEATMIALIEAVAGGGVYLDVTGENEIYGQVHDGVEEASGIVFDVLAGGPVDINISHTEMLDDQLAVHHALGLYDINEIRSTSGDVHVTAAAGDLRIGRITSPGTVVLEASRNIYAADGGEGITAGAVLLTGKAIGPTYTPVLTHTPILAAVATGGPVHLRNTSALTIGQVRGVSGVVADGLVLLESDGPMTIATRVAAGGSIAIEVPDTMAMDDDIRVLSGASVSSAQADVLLDAGDGVYAQAGSTVAAAESIRIEADAYSEDFAGANVVLSGELDSEKSIITTGPHADRVDLSGLSPSADASGVLVNTLDGDDHIIGSDGPETISPGTGADTVLAGGGRDIVTGIEAADVLLRAETGAGRAFDQWMFHLAAGQTVVLRASGDAAGISLMGLDPHGRLLRVGTDVLSITAASEGEYTVRASSALMIPTGYTLRIGDAPRVESVVVNDGLAQRSNLSSVTIRLNDDAGLAALVASGQIANFVRLVDQATGQRVAFVDASRFTYDAPTRTLRIDLTVDGPGGSEQSAMVDGRYEVDVDLRGLAAATGIQVADDDGHDDRTLRLDRSTGAAEQDLFQLRGDLTGDGVVDRADLAKFTGPGPSDQREVDVNGDGRIDEADRLGLVNALGRRVAKPVWAMRRR